MSKKKKKGKKMESDAASNELHNKEHTQSNIFFIITYSNK